MRGLSEEYGSWKIICIWRRSGRSRSRGRVATSTTSPLVGAEQDLARGRLDRAQDAARGRRLAAAALADQAQRLASLDVKLTPSTARTWPTTLRRKPRRIGKNFSDP